MSSTDPRPLSVAVDIGGTFTDVTLQDAATGEAWTAKTPSTPADPSEGFLNGVRLALEAARGDAARVGRVLHGTTIATNLILEGKGARSIRNPHVAGLGAAMAAMHLAAEGFALSRPNSLSVAGWRGLFSKFSDRADEILPGLSLMIENELSFLEKHWPVDLPSGVIHADLFPDNVFYEGEQLSGIIDFYFACNDMFAYDLAICMNAWCFERKSEFNITKAKLLLANYHRVRLLSAAELQALPLLCRGAALRFLLTRSYDWLNRSEGALVTPKDPMEYVKKLQFHQKVQRHEEYGL